MLNHGNKKIKRASSPVQRQQRAGYKWWQNKGASLFKYSGPVREKFKNRKDFRKFNAERLYRKKWKKNFFHECARFWGWRMGKIKGRYHIKPHLVATKVRRKRFKLKPYIQQKFKGTVTRRLMAGLRPSKVLNLNRRRNLVNLEANIAENNSNNPWNRLFSRNNVFRSRVVGKLKGHLTKKGKKKKAQKNLYTALLVIVYRYRLSSVLSLSEMSGYCRPAFILRRFVRRRKIEEYPAICKKQQQKSLPIKWICSNLVNFKNLPIDLKFYNKILANFEKLLYSKQKKNEIFKYFENYSKKAITNFHNAKRFMWWQRIK